MPASTVLLALLALEFALVVALWRRNRATAEQRGIRRSDGVVECRSCGTENEREYAFCRNCVNELPDPSVVDYSTSRPPGRFST